MSGLKELLSDDHGRWDIGYVSLAVLIVLILGCIPVILGGAIVQMGYDEHHVFPLLDVGKAVGLITAAFGSPLLALAGYIMAMKSKTAPLPPDAIPPPAVVVPPVPDNPPHMALG
jgi:hypothetical protein